MDCAGGTLLLNTVSPVNALQPVEALERERHLRSNDGRAGLRSQGREDCDDPLSSKLRFDCRAVDATYLKAHRTATGTGVKKGGVDA